MLFCCYPAHGHLLPMLPLADAARTAGHEVVLASGAELSADAARLGLPFWQVGPSRAETDARHRTSSPPNETLTQPERIRHNINGIFGPSNELRAVDLVPRAVEWKPDLIVSAFAELTGAVAAAHTGARVATHSLGQFPAGFLAHFEPSIEQLGRQWDVPDLLDRVLDTPYLDIVPPALQPDGPADFRRVRPIRPTAGIAPADARQPFDLDALPYEDAVYVTLGTIFNGELDVFEAVLGGLRELPVNVFVTAGPGADPTALGPQPKHVIVTDYVPQALLLPYCRLVISHGGSGTVLGTLCHGVPQLLVPRGADQFLNATAVTRAGAGLALPPDVLTKAAVAEAAERLLAEPTYAEAAGRIHAEIAAMPAASRVLAGLLDGSDRA
ncbi:glycosyltransferase [Flindersiella endophytica]